MAVALLNLITVLLTAAPLGHAVHRANGMILVQTRLHVHESFLPRDEQPLPAALAVPEPRSTQADASTASVVSPRTRRRGVLDALVTFLLAVAASRVLGNLFPQLSRGIMPQISGYLFMGMVLGPYCTDVLSQARMDLISGPINRICLSFIAGAAGAEMYLPELRGRLGSMVTQVCLICMATLVLCFAGLFVLTATGALTVLAVNLQQTLAARIAVTMLAATLMTARSPASAIAVTAELGCSELPAAKVCLGVTVLSDVAVLILFAICTQIVRVVTQGSSFGPWVLVSVVIQLVASILLGVLAGPSLCFVVPANNAAKMNERETNATSPRNEKLEPVSNEAPLDGDAAGGWEYALKVLRGAVLIGILYGVSLVSACMGSWSRERLRLEPLLVCAAAACTAGHNQARRTRFLDSLMWWTNGMVLPFFTLAGASLELPRLCAVLPAALTLAALRLLSIACGSIVSGILSSRLDPGLQLGPAEVKFTWLTLVAQAGVTLGLVLEVQQSFGGSWSADFATLITGVVVLNQLLGPVLGRLGLQLILSAEKAELAEMDDIKLPYEAK